MFGNSKSFLICAYYSRGMIYDEVIIVPRTDIFILPSLKFRSNQCTTYDSSPALSHPSNDYSSDRLCHLIADE